MSTKGKKKGRGGNGRTVPHKNGGNGGAKHNPKVEETPKLPTCDEKPKLPKLPTRARAHENLVALDALQLTYDGWEKDKKGAEDVHFNKPSKFNDHVRMMKEKQAFHDGDRSHPLLQRLDAMTFTYPKWKKDQAKAEKHHIDNPDSFESRIDSMRKKQKLHDRSDPDLQGLDVIVATYPGWEKDKSAAEEAFLEGSCGFQGLLDKMKSKQKDQEDNGKKALKAAALDSSTADDCSSFASGGGYDNTGGDSFSDDDNEKSPSPVPAKKKPEAPKRDPRLVALDTMSFTYPRWKEEKTDLENGWSFSIDSKVERMKRKQRIHEGDRSAPRLKTLDALTLSYHGWKADVSNAENSYMQYGGSIDYELKQMKRKQTVHDRSDPKLMILDSFTYPESKKDKKSAEKLFIDDCSWSSETFDVKVQGMKRKQAVHDRSDPKLKVLDSFTYLGWKNDKKWAQQLFIDNNSSAAFDVKVQGMKRKQAVHDRSDPLLQALDSFTYPGWEEDKSIAENLFISNPDRSEFDDKLQGMKHKQQAHEGTVACPILLLDDEPAPADAGPHHNDGNLDEIRPSAGRPHGGAGNAADPLILGDSDDENYNTGSRAKRRRPKTRKRHKGMTTTRNPTCANTKCAFCFKEDKTHTLQPCGHRCLCATCADREKKCPVCGKAVVSAEATELDLSSQNVLLDLSNCN